MAAPKVGYEQDGYRFKGGNPADPSNWGRLPPEKGDVENGYRFLGGKPSDPNSWGKLEDEGGFWSTLFEKAQTLGMADEAAAFAKNPTEANRKALLAAGESKKRDVGFGEGANWVAFKQMLGGSLGSMLAPAAAGLAATPFTSPVGGLAAFSATSGTQYTTENLLRQAQAQERAIQEGEAPEDVSVGKALAAAAGQTGLDLLGGKVFKGVASKFPFMRPLLGEAGEKAAREAGDVLADAAERGTISFAGGVARGVGKGVSFEVPQELAQTWLERWQAGLDLNPLTSEEARNEYGQAAIGAALLGGTFGAVSGGLESRAKPEGERGTEEEGTPKLATQSEMDRLVEAVLTDPEDKAAFDQLTKHYADAYGIPEETAAKLAFGMLRPEAATQGIEAETETEAVPEPTLRTAEKPPMVKTPSVIPPVETITPEAQIKEQLEEVAPAPAPAPAVAPAPAPAVAPVEAAAPVAEAPTVTPVETAAPVAEAPAVEAVAPVAEAPAVEPMQPNAIWASQDFDLPVTVLPEEPQVGEDGRAYQAVMYNGQQGFLPVEQLRPLNLTAAEVTPQAAPEAVEEEEAVPPEFLAAEDAFEETVTAAPAEAAPEPVAPEGAEETPVPVTKVEPGDARGARQTQRGTQGVVKGRPVEGAAELTAGMQDEQALTERLRNMRMSNLISDRDVGEVLNILRPPTSAEGLNAMPESQQQRWRQVLDLTRDMNAKAEQRDNAKGKEKAQLNAAVKALDSQIDAVRSQLAKYAMGEAALRVEKRKADRAQVEEDFKSGEINRAERDRQLAELRIDRPMGELLQEKWYKEADPAEAAFVESGIEGKSFEDALQWVINNAPNEAYRTIAEAVQNNIKTLKRVGWKFDFRIAHLGDPIPKMMFNALGLTTWKGGARTVDVILHGTDVTGKVGTTFETFLHEAIHAATAPLLRAGNFKGMQPYRFAKATQDLIDVFNHVVAEFNKKVKSGAALTPMEEAIYKRSTNVLKQPDEVLAWALTNPEVMAYFDTMQYTPKHTVFSKIVEIVRKVLGLPSRMDSALAEILRVSETLLNTSSVEAKEASDALRSLAISTGYSPQQVEADKKVNKGLHKAQLANDAAGFTEGLDEAVAGTKLENAQKRKAAVEAMTSTTFTPAKLALQPTSWIRDAITKIRPGLGSVVEGINRLEQQMRGMRNSMERAMRRRVTEVKGFVQKHGQAQLSAMMTIARVNRVDVTAYATRAEALKNDPVIKAEEGRGNSKGVNRRKEDINAAWDAWEALGKQPGGHETYKKMRQFYKDMYNALRAAQDEDIRALGLDKAATDKLIQEARGDIEGELVDEGPHKGLPENVFPAEYFPFRRFGEYVLFVKTGKRAERERYHFESARERNLFQAKRAKQLGLQRGTDEYNEVFDTLDGLENLRDNIEQESFLLGKLFEAVDGARLAEKGTPEDTAKLRKSIKDRLYQTYLLTLPERSLRKQFIHAELVSGQSADVARVFTAAASQYAAQLPKVVYGNQIQTQIEAAYDTVKGGDPAERAKLRAMLNTIVRRTRDAMDPQPRSAAEQRIGEFTFLSLMSSIASAAVQPFTLPFQVMPRMISRYGVGNALKMVSGYTPLLKIVEATKDVDPSTGEVTFTAPTLGNTKYIKNNPLRARLWKELDQNRDLFSQKQTDMLLRNRPTPGTSNATFGQRALSKYETVVDVSGALFSSMDQLTREISGMSFAELEYDKQRAAGKSHEEAIQAAVDASVRNTDETIGNYTEVQKLDVFRGGPLRRMLGFLRTYSVERTAYYFRMLNSITEGDPTQTRLQAFNELSMVLAFTALGAGVGANFGYDAICKLIDLLTAAVLDDEEKEEWRRRDPLGADSSDYRFRFQWVPEQFGPDSLATRIAQRGVLSTLTGYDWTTRLSQSSLWLRDYQKGETTRETIMNFLAANLSPQVSQGANMIDGIDEFMNGNWSKGFTKIAPAAVRGIFTAERYASEGETTKSGLPVMGSSEFTTNELLGQVAGFTPDKLAREREMSRMTQAWKRSMKEERDNLFEEFRDVLDDPNHTREDVKVVVEKVQRFNAKVPLDKQGNPLTAYLIEPRDIAQSIRGRGTLEKKSYRGVKYAPGERDLFFPYEKRKPLEQ